MSNEKRRKKSILHSTAAIAYGRSASERSRQLMPGPDGERRQTLRGIRVEKKSLIPKVEKSCTHIQGNSSSNSSSIHLERDSNSKIKHRVAHIRGQTLSHSYCNVMAIPTSKTTITNTNMNTQINQRNAI